MKLKLLNGLEIAYRCPKCRGCIECKKGDIFEDISLKEEQEQHEIFKSITLDKENKTIWAALPLRIDPDEVLKENKNLAVAFLNRLCTKYSGVVKQSIVAALTKLNKRGHLIFEDEYPEELKELLKKKSGHFIVYDVAFSESVSTPARPVFNASKNTPGGTNLNDCLYRGTPTLTNMIGVLLDWNIDLFSMLADISQFYNCFKLQVSHLVYQKIMYRENLDPSNDLWC